uniref:Cyclic nucleotide-binding domain-containing protein n=1 Tax=Syphacia muris TaxID=451379 RepID=A0A0N5AVK1_9BILA
MDRSGCSSSLLQLRHANDVRLRLRSLYFLDILLSTLSHFSKSFVADVAAVIPTDLLRILTPNLFLVRINRLFKVYRVWQFVDLIQIRTSFPSIFRILKMVAYCYLLFHWNGCLYFYISLAYNIDDGTPMDWKFSYSKILNPTLMECKSWAYPEKCLLNETGRDVHYREIYLPHLQSYWSNRTYMINFGNFTRKYMQTFYWSALTLISLGEQPPPNKTFQNGFEICDTVIGLVVFAIIVSDISNMVDELNASKSEFESELDECKLYMLNRKVMTLLQTRVINWFWYMKSEGIVTVDEEDCSKDLLVDIVLRLKLRIYSPLDYICKKGDVGKEMYIIKEGLVQVVSGDGKTVFAMLGKGSVFGGISILNIPGNKDGNRRTADVRSVGYTDVYVLSKDDLWEILVDYPIAKAKLLESGMASLYKTIKHGQVIIDDDDRTMPKGKELLKKDGLLEDTDDQLELYNCISQDEKASFLQQMLSDYDSKLNELHKDVTVMFISLHLNEL